MKQLSNLLRLTFAAIICVAAPLVWAQKVTELSAESLPDFLKKNANVLVQFTSPDRGCGYCVGADAAFDRAVAKGHALHPKWVYARVQWAPWAKFPVFSVADLTPPGIPHQVFFVNAKKVGYFSGASKMDAYLPDAIDRAEKGITVATEDIAYQIEQEARDRGGESPKVDAGKTIEAYVQQVRVARSTLGSFPFFSPPQGYEFGNGGGKKWAATTTFVPVAGQKLVPVEGQAFGAYIRVPNRSPISYSSSFVLKSFDDIITSIGGVKIFDGTIPLAEVKRADSDKTLRKSEGSIDWYNNDKVKTYAIKSPEGGLVLVLLQSNSASGSIQVVQAEAFKQTIALKDAKSIQSDLETSGKAVLQINFETDKAVLAPDGLQAVTEIVRALQGNTALRISIEGHTDSQGSEARNLQLSKERALAVQQVLTLSGIDKARLKTGGFGASRPVASNSNEAGMAKNRRVELVRY